MTDFTSVLAAILAIGGALYALNAHQLMRGVLGLAAFFVGIATFFADLGAWYLAAGQLILFVGGVVTLFVLAFNTTNTPALKSCGLTGLLIALALGVVGFMLLPAAIASPTPPSLASFSMTFFTSYGWIVNITLLLLFSAVLGAQYLMEER